MSLKYLIASQAARNFATAREAAVISANSVEIARIAESRLEDDLAESADRRRRIAADREASDYRYRRAVGAVPHGQTRRELPEHIAELAPVLAVDDGRGAS